MLTALLFSPLLASIVLAAPSSSGSSSFPAQCLPTDIEGSVLDFTNVTASGLVTCAWQIACDCQYLSPSGKLSSGSSSCPQNIHPGGGSSSASSGFQDPGSGSGSSSSASAAPGKDLSSGNALFEDSRTNDNHSLSPAVIAGLVINGVFVLGFLILIAVWIFKRPKAKSRSGMKVLYTGVDNGRETFIPLTHGTSDGTYYDPHEPADRDKEESKLAPGGEKGGFDD